MAKGDFNPQTDRYPGNQERELARWIMTTARRYLTERDPASALDEACQCWLNLRQKSAPSAEPFSGDMTMAEAVGERRREAK